MLKLDKEKSTGIDGVMVVNKLLSDFGLDITLLTFSQSVDIAIDVKKAIENQINKINNNQ